MSTISTFSTSSTFNQLPRALVKRSPSERFGYVYGRSGVVFHILSSQWPFWPWAAFPLNSYCRVTSIELAICAREVHPSSVPQRGERVTRSTYMSPQTNGRKPGTGATDTTCERARCKGGPAELAMHLSVVPSGHQETPRSSAAFSVTPEIVEMSDTRND